MYLATFFKISTPKLVFLLTRNFSNFVLENMFLPYYTKQS